LDRNYLLRVALHRLSIGRDQRCEISVFSRTRPFRRFAMNTCDASTATGSPLPAFTPANPARKQKAMPSTTFATQSPDQTFAMILGRILAGMTGNPAYANPQPALAELGAIGGSHSFYQGAGCGHRRTRTVASMGAEGAQSPAATRRFI
jgi:hypothetical protein